MAVKSRVYGADPPEIELGARVRSLSGMTFGKLTCVKPIDRRNNGHVVYLCDCQCGLRIVATCSNLKSGHTQSCGCRQREVTGEANRSHGRSNTKLYRRWCQMIQRCHKPYAPNYAHYGERGIVVCDRWRHSFENFLEDMGEPPPGLSLDRVDNDGPYAPWNCIWADRSTQIRNSRKVIRSRHVTVGEKSQPISSWARENGVNPETIRKRLNRGWAASDAVSAQ